MSTINKCEGDDIQLLVEELNSTARQSIKNIIDKEELTSYRVVVKGFETYGGNYLGSLQRVTINGKTKDGRDKELKLFLKNIPCAPEEYSTFINVSNVYQREGFFYKELFHVFEKIQDKYNITHGERFKKVKGFSTSNDELIILEDVSHMGYKTYDRFDVIPIKFAELAIEQIAKLHAMSFIIRKEDPMYFENNIVTLKSVDNINANFEDYVRKSFDIAKESLEEKVKCKLDKNYQKLIENYFNNLKILPHEAVCVIHGDFRPNNVLVKETNNEPSDVILIDYQLASPGSPVLDILKLIFLGTDQHFRRNHMDDLKALYYSSFEIFLRKFNIEAREVYSKEQFEKDFKNKLDYGLVIFLVCLPFIFGSTDRAPKIEQGFDVAFDLDERFRERLYGVVDDFIHWGYL